MICAAPVTPFSLLILSRSSCLCLFIVPLSGYTFGLLATIMDSIIVGSPLFSEPKLIELVKRKPLLWNHKDPYYNNRKLEKDCWAEISDLLETDSEYYRLERSPGHTFANLVCFLCSRFS